MRLQILQLSSQKIAYYESSGAGSPVMFIHGNSASGRTFQKQLESTFGETHRLVAIDLPGHGDSDPAADLSAYSLPGYAQVVAEAAQALNMEEAVFVGWSLGGHIVLEAHNLLPQAKGLAIYGTPPLAFPPDMENAFLPNPVVNIGFTPDLTEEQATAYAAAFFAPDASVDLTPFIHDILRTDGQARAGLGASIQPDGYQDEVAVVANLSLPLAVLHGEAEQLVNVAYIRNLTMPTLWRGAVQIISGAGHAPHWEQPDQFNAQLAAFAADVM